MQLSIQKPYQEELGELLRVGAVQRALGPGSHGGLHRESVSYFVRRLEDGAPDPCDAHAVHGRWNDRGLPVADVAASGVDERGTPFLVFATPAGRLLDEVLSGPLSSERRRSLTRALGQLVRRLHDAGEWHGALTAWNLVVTEGGDPLLLNVGSTPRTPLAANDRIRDLAALFATLSRAQLSSVGRWRLLDECVADPAERRSLRRVVRRERQRLHRQGCFPRGPWLEQGPVGPDAGRDGIASTASLFVHSSVVSAVPSAVASIPGWMDPPGARCVRERDGRRNLTWESPGGERWYGKHHLTRGRHARPAALREFDAHRSLEWLGLPVPVVRLVAADPDGSSVLWTRGLQPGTTLRDHLHAAGPEAADEGRRALDDVARCVRRLHGAGFCHRDLYLDHFLLEENGGVRRWVLIDLMRLQESSALPRRARLRDLARLEYSARTCRVSRTSRLRAFRTYLGGVRHVDRRLCRAVLARADRIERRERRHGRFPVPAP